MLVARMAVVDAPHDAEGLGRPAVGARIPAAGILEPIGGPAVLAVGTEQIFDLVGNAFAFVLVDGAHHRVIARGEIVGIEEIGIGAPCAKPCRRAMQHLGRIGAPEDLVRFDHPVIGGLAHRHHRLAHPLELFGADDALQRFDRRLRIGLARRAAPAQRLGTWLVSRSSRLRSASLDANIPTGGPNANRYGPVSHYRAIGKRPNNPAPSHPCGSRIRRQERRVCGRTVWPARRPAARPTSASDVAALFKPAANCVVDPRLDIDPALLREQTREIEGGPARPGHRHSG